MYKSDGTSIWFTTYGRSDSAGVIWFDTDSYNPTTSSTFTNLVFYVKCTFGSPNAEVTSNPITATLACKCNQYTVTLTDYLMSTTNKVFTMSSSNNPYWIIYHWDNSNTACCVTETSDGNVDRLFVYTSAAMDTLHPDLEVVYYSSSRFKL